MSIKKTGIGIIGLGSRGLYFVKKFEGEKSEVVAVHDTDTSKIEKFASQAPYIKATCSLEEFLDAPGLEAVVICSPDKNHAEHTIAVLKRKKHIFLEKPMAQNIADCDRMIDAWQGTDTVFMVGLELRYCSLMKDVKKLVDKDIIGEVKTGTVIDNVSVGGQYYFHGRRRRKEYIKSLVLEKGTHSLDLTNWIVNDSPKRVFCSSGLDVYGGNESNTKRCRDCEIKDTCKDFIDYKGFKMDYGVIIEPEDLCAFAKECDVEDNSLIIIDYAKGARICYMECHFTPEYSREFMFVGTKGKLTAFYNNEQDFKITVQKRFESKTEVYYPEKVNEGSAHGGGDDGIIEEFLEKVRVGKPSMKGIKGARDSAAIAIAAEESSSKNLPVTISQKDIPEFTV